MITKIKEYAKVENRFFATPFDFIVEFLEEFNFPAYKIASADITIQFFKQILKQKKGFF